MNEKWNYFSILPALVVIVALTACKKEPVHIGLAKYNDSPSNNLLTERIMAIVNKKHPEVIFAQENAEGHTDRIEEISTQFAANTELKLRVAVDAPIAQAFAEDDGAPIIYVGVTDPESAGLLESSSPITGYKDPVSTENAFKELLAIMPDLSLLGQIESLNEANSAYMTGVVRYRAAIAGINSTKTTVISNIAQITDAVSALVALDDKVDVLYLANSSLLFKDLANIVEIANRNLVPVVTSDSVSAANAGVMLAYGPNYAQMAEATANLLIQFLEAQDDEARQAIFAEKDHTLEGADASELYIDPAVVRQFGYSVPAEVLDRALQPE